MKPSHKEQIRAAHEKRNFMEVLNLIWEAEDMADLTTDPNVIDWMNDAAVIALQEENASWVATLIEATDSKPEKIWTKLDKDVVAASIAVMVYREDTRYLGNALPIIRSTWKDDPEFMAEAQPMVGVALDDLASRTIRETDALAARGGFSLGDRMESTIHELLAFPEILSQSYAPVARYMDYVSKDLPNVDEWSDEEVFEATSWSLDIAQGLHKVFNPDDDAKFLLPTEDMTELRASLKSMKPGFIEAVEKNAAFSELVGLHCRLYPSLYPNAAKTYGGNPPPALPAP